MVGGVREENGNSADDATLRASTNMTATTSDKVEGPSLPPSLGVAGNNLCCPYAVNNNDTHQGSGFYGRHPEDDVGEHDPLEQTLHRRHHHQATIGHDASKRLHCKRSTRERFRYILQIRCTTTPNAQEGRNLFHVLRRGDIVPGFVLSGARGQDEGERQIGNKKGCRRLK